MEMSGFYKFHNVYRTNSSIFTLTGWSSVQKESTSSVKPKIQCLSSETPINSLVEIKGSVINNQGKDFSNENYLKIMIHRICVQF